MISNIKSVLNGVHRVAIAGHVRPDGDCVGSCMGMYLYLQKNYPDIQADVYMEEVRDVFSYIKSIDEVKHEWQADVPYDLLLLFDVSSLDRIGVASEGLKTIADTVCIDHHVTNAGIAKVNHVRPNASSTCEVLFELLDDDKITKEIAEPLYTGIVHDTGVFQYSCTGQRTMEIAGCLMAKGIDFTKIVKDSFYTKTYEQNQIMGRTVMESIMLLDKKVIVGSVRTKQMQFYGITPKDLDGIVNQLQNTQGVEVAIFLYEVGMSEFKVSLRSNGIVDVARVAQYFGGGGHRLAAGCTLCGTVHDVVNMLTGDIEEQLQEYEAKNGI